ncbi:methyltransferase domain-containing protein [Paenibacillus sp. PK4536]|uniref:class I SAM-dependent methyltransferase n=1 Tax=Paenibacillus sp. PK4536 TaxID=3024576 RepID=UPI00235895D7|nr:methyltransferase domain-containing protein [Paenibacillus sp. PK4536]WIM39765.1 methyltransferase domain-containing protein [Paenibacillus sp. PK4536]
MIHVIYDQYQRYNNVSILINRFRTPKKSFRILEVGANEHRNLEKFLPDDIITYLDIELPEHLLNDPQYILGDATDMKFEDDQYDVVVALDVFEHIPSEKRNQFIDELQRVSKEFFIITAPFDSPTVVQAEIAANSIYKGIFGKDFIWLQEHRDNGLPHLDSLENYLRSKKDITYKIIGHGNVDIWEKMMKIHFFTAYNPKLNFFRDEIDRFYNSNIFEWDYSQDSYRKIVIASKQMNISLLNEHFSEKTIPVEYKEKLEVMEKDFYNMVSLLTKAPEIKQEVYKDELKIYINTGEGYNEENTIIFNLKESVHLDSYEVDLSNYEFIHSIRIDPSNYAGIYKINNIKLLNDEKKIGYLVDGNFDLSLEETYIFEQDDPYITLNFEYPFHIKVLELDVYVFSKNYEVVIKEVKKIFEFKKDKRKGIRNNLELIQNKYDELLILQNENSVKYEKMILDYQQKIENQQKELEQYKNHADQRIQQTNKEKIELLQELNTVYNSKTWQSILVLKRFIGKK